MLAPPRELMRTILAKKFDSDRVEE